MIRLLHLVGSPTDEYNYKISVLYAKACDSHGDFDFHYAVLKPDKTWTFTKSLDGLEELEEENPGSIVPMSLAEAVQHITGSIRPDAAIHHMFCTEGTVYYRSLMEMLNIQLIGPTSQCAMISTNKALTRGAVQTAASESARMPDAVYLNSHLYETTSSPQQMRENIGEVLGMPCVVKSPCIEDSRGVFLAKTDAQLEEAISKAFQLDDEMVTILKNSVKSITPLKTKS